MTTQNAVLDRQADGFRQQTAVAAQTLVPKGFHDAVPRIELPNGGGGQIQPSGDAAAVGGRRCELSLRLFFWLLLLRVSGGGRMAHASYLASWRLCLLLCSFSYIECLLRLLLQFFSSTLRDQHAEIWGAMMIGGGRWYGRCARAREPCLLDGKRYAPAIFQLLLFSRRQPTLLILACLSAS